MEAELFDCSNCPGFCCSYDVISLSEDDVERISTHLGVSVDECIRKFTKYGAFRGESRYPLMMKHKRDQYFGTICNFFDEVRRCCRIYEARPEACRAFPHGNRCGYYEFLTFERELQGDENHVAVTR